MNSGLFEHIRTFAAIAKAGSLTRASIVTGIGQATISRQLAALERHLGCRLFHRSTRAISLTEEGQNYLRHSLRILELADEAASTLQDGSARLRGRLRVACSNGFGRKLLIPALPVWQAEHPQVHVELVLSDHPTRLIEEGIDVAFRTALLRESGLVARAVGVSRRIVVASPAYVRRYGLVKEPAQLREHECIIFAGAEHPSAWNLEGPEGQMSVHVQGRLTLSTVDALQDAVLAGIGIAMMPAWFWTREILSGQVVQLLPKYRLPEQIINALTSARQRPTSRVKKFVDHIEQVLLARSTTSKH
jgi:DNA-binding transcriptional LysR family regulator